MLLEGGVTQNNYLDKDGKLKVLDDVYAAKIRENVTPYIDDYIKEKKDFSDWKKRAYTGEALQLLSGLVPMGTVGNLAVRGLVSGLTGGAIEGFGRGLVEDKNPLQTAAYDAAIGGLTGGAIGKAAPYVNKNVVVPFQRKMRAGINPFSRTNKEVLANENSFIDLTEAFNKPGLNLANSLQDAKNFINVANTNGTEFQTASPDFILDMLGNSKQRNHILRSDKAELMDDIDKLKHNIIISNFNEVSKGLKPITNEPIANKKPLKKPKVQNYYYFEGNVKNGEDTIPIIADAEQKLGEPVTKPLKLHLYNLYDKKFSPILNGKSSVKLGENNNIITEDEIKIKPSNPKTDNKK